MFQGKDRVWSLKEFPGRSPNVLIKDFLNLSFYFDSDPRSVWFTGIFAYVVGLHGIWGPEVPGVRILRNDINLEITLLFYAMGWGFGGSLF